MSEPVPPTEVPARVIPVPASVSPVAQQYLAPNPLAGADFPMPPNEDIESWRAIADMATGGVLEMMLARTADLDVVAEVREVDGVPVYVITPARADAEGKVLLDLHGGAFFIGGGECCRASGTLTAGELGLVTWAVDYRMPPDHPYPAALDDCLTAYRALLESHAPEHIVVSGASAGGNLAAALVLRASDEGLPLPGALVLLTPEVDLTESGDSFQTNLGIDNVLTSSLAATINLYAAGEDLSQRYLSPLFAELPAGHPPTFLVTGTRDLFLSNTVRMHRALRAADIRAELHVFEAMPHGGFMGAPEDDEIYREARRFIESV